MPAAVAYLRKSRSDDPSKEVSEDVQRRAIEAMATRDGATVTEWYKDWDRSADDAKSKRRTDYQRMVRSVEDGGVATIYAYSVDRLYRSLPGFLRLTDTASAHNTRIVTHREGVVGGDGSPMASAFAQIGAVFTELELNTAKARAKAAHAARVARGDHIGQVPYGHRLVKGPDGVNRLEPDETRPVGPLIDAYKRANGRVRTAVRIVNDELRIPAPYGGEWDRTSFLRVLRREAPDLMPPKTVNNRREAPATPAVLAKLLRCHCGRLLTPNRHVEKRRANGTTAISYYCAKGNSTPKEHGQPYYVSERILLPWVQAEAARLRIPFADYRVGLEVSEAERDALHERRRRVGDAFTMGAYDRDQAAAKVAEIEAELELLDAQTRVEALPPEIDWSAPPEVINAVLRALFVYIELGRDLRPARAEWSVPDWRSPEPVAV